MGRKISDLTGNVYSRLTVVRLNGRRYGKALWLCKCECGNELDVPNTSLQSSNTKSCGCLHAEGNSKGNPGKRVSYDIKSSEYRIWCGMRNRCYNTYDLNYPNYGGRGIIVCIQWRNKGSFPVFLTNMGPRPSLLHSLDRIDNEGNYTPENCRWATKSVQNNNQRKVREMQLRIDKLVLENQQLKAKLKIYEENAGER